MAGEAKQKPSKRHIQKCHPLDPVLELSVAEVDEAPRQQPQQRRQCEERFEGRSVLTRLRDGYVKLMNDMASSADSTGVSTAYYGCCAGRVNFVGPVAMATSRPGKQDEEMEQVARMAAAASQSRRNQYQ